MYILDIIHIMYIFPNLDATHSATNFLFCKAHDVREMMHVLVSGTPPPALTADWADLHPLT